MKFTLMMSMALVCLPVVAAALARGDQSAAGPSFESATPNLVVASLEKSLAFYRDVLGFELDMHVPDQPPYVFVSVKRGGVQIFLNDIAAVRKDFPALADRARGGGNTMYIKMTGVEAYHRQIEKKVKIVVPFVRQPYGMTEFGIEDPDGYVIFFAEQG